jgi:intraflagellar transport protein 81
LKEKLDNVKS